MIHKFSQNGLYFVIDVASGAIHAVDETVYDIVDIYESKSEDEIIELFKSKYLKDDILECLCEINELKDNGLLFSKDIYENIPHKEVGTPVVKALCMHMAHDCNLRCGYCFGDGGAFHDDRQLMSVDTAKAAINYVLKNSGKRRNIEIDFFGGEPLMNFEVIKETVSYARKMEKEYNKNFNFTLTTNGVLLNEENIKYINDNMQNVVLSLDGRKSVNDGMRKTVGGKGSYDIVAPKFKVLINGRKHKNYYIRGTYTSKNLDFSEDALHINSLGFKQLSVEPVVTGCENEYAIRESSLEEIYYQYEKLCLDMLKLNTEGCGFEFFHYNMDLEGGPCVYKRLAGCGAGTEYLAVTPGGELYPCHQLVGNEKYLLGNVYDGILNLKAREAFQETSVYSKEKCKSCWAKFYCGGGCHANAININSNINEPYEIGCKLMRKRAECAIFYQDKRMNEQNVNKTKEL